ncbi:PDR/VanB family oxidoreductase [Piscinibacter sakaiensis]|uniref:PDR/VanB family oxidoreductase n=1 Tax=Piscinibacter sakaiensis TaxID=1547922 RepID=UPI003AAF6BB9
MNAPVAHDLLRPQSASTLRLQLRGIRLQAEGIHAFELVHPEGDELPGVEAGAHVDVTVPGGQVRSYSLAGDPNDRSRWTLGVLRESKGQGGSRALHDSVRVGDLLEIGAPRNAFSLKPGAEHVILLAGGIGITPLKAMAHVLTAEGCSFELHYCARSPRHAAFIDELRALVPADRLHLHFDGGDPARGLDIAALLARPAQGCHVYYCGPSGFMKACAEATSHWNAGTVHCEHFKAPAPTRPVDAVEGCFEVRLARTGITLQVQPEQTIVRAIELAGHRVPTSCLSGLCGACKVDYLEGEVDHQDYILSDEEKARCLTVCCSRAKSATLVLDL